MSGIDALMSAANRALYEAKANGQNCRVAWLPPVPEKVGERSRGRLAVGPMVPAEGIEPPTFGLQNRCSTAELSRLSYCLCFVFCPVVAILWWPG